jgi:hypothetical protein
LCLVWFSIDQVLSFSELTTLFFLFVIWRWLPPFLCFSQEMYDFQNAARTNFLVFGGWVKVWYTEKGIIYNTISLAQIRTCGVIDFSWRKPIHEFFCWKIISEATKKIQLVLQSMIKNYIYLSTWLLAFYIEIRKG